VLDVDGAEAVMCGMAMGLAVNAEVLVGVFVLELAVFGEVGASACVADVGYFFATGSDVLCIYGVAFVAAVWFREQFAGDAAFAGNI